MTDPARHDKLQQLAHLIQQRMALDAQIAALTNRPAERGHTGEYIASLIFNITLERSATNKGSDGRFQDGRLAGKSVNIKWRGVNNGGFALTERAVPDYYLVLTVPRLPPRRSLGQINPWVIGEVYLLSGEEVRADVVVHNRRIGPGATSISPHLWRAGEIYPTPSHPLLILSEAQHEMLQLFSSNAILPAG